MPVFHSRSKQVKRETQIDRLPVLAGSGKTRGKFIHLPKKKWDTETTSITELENSLKVPLRKQLAELPGKPVVVDWGCGSGRAVSQIAEQVPKANCYGFSSDSYLAWNRAIEKNKNAKFIQAPETDFFSYFKNGSIDLVYSHLGFVHLFSTKPQLKREYMEYVVPKLKIGGRIIFSSPDFRMQSTGKFSFERTANDTCIITRLK